MFEVVFKKDMWDWWWAVQDSVDTEVAAFGYCVNDRKGELYVDELFLVPQIAERAGIDFFTEGLPYAIQKAVQDERIEHLRFCIHSHCDFSVHWSNTDEDMIRKVGSTGTPWFASVVTNKKHEAKARLDMWDPYMSGLGQISLKEGIGLGPEIDPTLYEGIAEELKQFLKKPPPKPTTTTANGKVTSATKDNVQDMVRGTDVSQGGVMWLSHDDALELAKELDWEGIAFDGFVYWFETEKGKRTTCVAQTLAPDDLDMPEDGTPIDLDDEDIQEQVAI